MGKGNPGGKRSDKIFSGARFGRLTVVKRLPKEQGKHRPIYRVLCKCDCGNESTPSVDALNAGNSTSCGCRKKECGAESARARMKPGEGYSKVIPGAKFGRLMVIKRIEAEGKLTSKVRCKCECGKITRPFIDGLIYGATKSCGCLASEVTAARNKENAKYGDMASRYPRTKASWSGMINRCYNTKQKSYKDYGAKGAVVCEYLKEHPRHLLELIGPRKNAKPSLDRFPIHDGNYTCGECKECKENGWKLNVRWATRRDQSNNRGNFNVYIEAFGKKLTMSQWRDLTGMSDETIRKRLRRGWSHEKIVSTPDRFGNCYKPKVDEE